jgi:uncharacterized membrane protein YfcA
LATAEAIRGPGAVTPPLGRIDMKTAYWIGLLALAGAIVGYAISRGTGWLDAGIGIVVGIVIGALVFARPNRNGPPPSAQGGPGEDAPLLRPGPRSPGLRGGWLPSHAP